jgi:hypothetical protein
LRDGTSAPLKVGQLASGAAVVFVGHHEGVVPSVVGKLECTSGNRCDHLIKTFFSGPGGWKDQQLPDGTVIFTSPSGHTYATEAHGGVLFPTLAQPTGQLPVPVTNDPSPYRAVMMPKRRRTREQDRRDRITEERRQRTELIAEEQRQRQAWLAATYEPPPF